MRKSQFRKEDVEAFVTRIEKLTPQTQPLWGKMNVAQMLTHCQKPYEQATGELITKPNPIVKFLFGKSARRQLMMEPVYKRNLPTFKEALIVDERDFNTEKAKLVQRIRNCYENGEAGIKVEVHPFFGPLSPREWDLLMVKHLDHHLTQFGV